jgi:predicted flavoprotein YhiN
VRHAGDRRRRRNFTNLGVAPERFVSANPHFVKSALARYTPANFIALVDSHGPRRAFRVSAIPKEPSPQ